MELDHVGSTSVPGLAAKPLIDIDLVVADTTDESAYVPKLEAIGYVLRVREPDWFEHRMLRGHDPPVNLHVFPPGCEEVERMLVFRDHLRSNAEDRELYERTKRELAARSGSTCRTTPTRKRKSSGRSWSERKRIRASAGSAYGAARG